MHARIRTARWESDGVMSFTLEPLAGEHFPSCTAGAHIDVQLANGINRSYSLLNDGSIPDCYEIAVQCDPDSRGGSSFIHENWRAGQVISIAPPRNNFPLNEEAAQTLLISGGIGITPMFAMIERLEALGRPWALHHAFKRREQAAFIDRLARYDPSRIVLHDDAAGTSLDLRALIADTEAGMHIYCCGPERMLAAFTDLTADRPAGFAHLEYFSGGDIVPAAGGYSLALKRSGKTIEVEAGETMLDALLDAGINVGFACSEGICGSCRVEVLDGVPDHRDRFLSPEEKRANKSVMVCCSGARTATLTLDL
ncbi:PDR/VanB family oxidoreductase [soil metagenome]